MTFVCLSFLDTKKPVLWTVFPDLDQVGIPISWWSWQESSLSLSPAREVDQVELEE